MVVSAVLSALSLLVSNSFPPNRLGPVFYGAATWARIYSDRGVSKGRVEAYEHLFVMSSFHLRQSFQDQLQGGLDAEPAVLPAIALPVELFHQYQIRSGDADEGQADRLVPVGGRPGHPGHRHREVASQPLAGSLGHGDRHL